VAISRDWLRSPLSFASTADMPARFARPSVTPGSHSPTDRRCRCQRARHAAVATMAGDIFRGPRLVSGGIPQKPAAFSRPSAKSKGSERPHC